MDKLNVLRVLRREMTVKAERIRSGYKNRSQSVVDQVKGGVEMLLDLGLIDTFLHNLCINWIEAEHNARQMKNCGSDRTTEQYEEGATQAYKDFDTAMISIGG